MDYIKEKLLKDKSLKIHTFYCGFCGNKEIALNPVRLCECGKICEANDDFFVEIKHEYETETEKEI